MTTKREWEQAKLAGMFARQSGRPITRCPMYGMGREGELLREAWRQGWRDEDDRRRGNDLL